MQKIYPEIRPSTISFIYQNWIPLLLGSTSAAAYLGLLLQDMDTGSLTFSVLPITLGWYALAFCAYIVLLIWIETKQRFSLGLIFGGAIIFRFIMLFTTPTLSGDVHRYVWDGYVANQGVSPYAYPIDSPALDYLDIPQRALIDHTWMASPYLPSAQVLFFAVTRIFPLQPVYFQLSMVIFDILTGILLISLLRVARLPDYRAYIYLWNPLVIIEVAHGAHVDAWMIFLTILAMWLVFSDRLPKLTAWLAPIVLAFAILTKGLPILILAILFWRWRWWQIALCVAVIVALIVPAGLRAGWGLSGPLDGHGLFGALRIFAAKWNFNSGIFHWLETALAASMPIETANVWAKRAVGGTMLVIMFGVWLSSRKLYNAQAMLRMMALPFMAYILLSATVHPWYLLIVLAFLPFLAPTTTETQWQWLSIVPWLYLSWAISLSYWTYNNPLDLREFPWVRNTEWQPTLLLIAIWLVWVTVTKLRLRINDNPII